jgi:hypothetical protein
MYTIVWLEDMQEQEAFAHEWHTAKTICRWLTKLPWCTEIHLYWRGAEVNPLWMVGL